MSSSRSSFISGTIFGIVLGILIGHLGIWRSAQTPTSPIVESFPVTEASLPGMSFDLGKKSESPPYFPEGDLQPVDDYPVPESVPSDEKTSPLANAIAMETVQVQNVDVRDEPAVVEIETPAEEPQPLDIDDAAPIEHHKSKNDAALKKVIEEELTHIPASQRDVWFESLKDMHVDDAQGVIRMWKLIGGPIPGLGEDSLIQPPTEMKFPINNTPDKSVDKTETGSSTAIEAAMRIVSRNLMMESTLGYMRIVPRFQEKLVDNQVVVAGVSEEFDFSQGSAIQTNRILDLMIQGSGFFEVEDSNGNHFVTRRGRFSLNDDRQLSIIDPDGEYVLQPPVTIPTEAKQIHISLNGSISFKDKNNESLKETAKVEIVEVLSDHQLSYYKNGLLKFDGETSSSMSISPERKSLILQGQLEVSNVNVNVEKQLLKQYQELMTK